MYNVYKKVEVIWKKREVNIWTQVDKEDKEVANCFFGVFFTPEKEIFQ